MSVDPSLYDALSRYIGLLSIGLRMRRRSEERELYTQHLADAAVMFHALREGDTIALREQLQESERKFGTSFLADNQGDLVEKAFRNFGQRVISPR